MEEEKEPVMISALEHYAYCPRQCALIHIEQTFTENVHTLRGNALHERADQPITRQEEGIRVERGLPLWSQKLGLIGKADVVEFHGEVPYPVEYKKGKRRSWQYEAIQVCAQALCLEEMLGLEVPRGAIYYGSSRNRREVLFDEALRECVVSITEKVRQMLHVQELPPAVNDQRCNQCSLHETCMPEVVIRPHSLNYYQKNIFTILDNEEGLFPL
jgi:CRISPR-associated exonuclease Cas4